jgi:ribose 5-phosphate isomerase A
MRQFAAMGGQATLRLRYDSPLVTDDGQYLVDVTGLQISDPWRLSPK